MPNQVEIDKKTSDIQNALIKKVMGALGKTKMTYAQKLKLIQMTQSAIARKIPPEEFGKEVDAEFLKTPRLTPVQQIILEDDVDVFNHRWYNKSMSSK